MLQDGAYQHDVKRPQAFGHGVHVPVDRYGVRLQRAVRQMIPVLPALDVGGLLHQPPIMVGVVHAFRKGLERLPVGGIHVERNDPRRAGLLGAETQKPGGGAYIENGPAAEVDVACIAREVAAEIPWPVHVADAGQIHGVIENALSDVGWVDCRFVAHAFIIR